jgi:uncharacterized protein (DUF488 family)
MSSLRGSRPLTIYSVGHSNHAEATFVALLKRHEIELVVDIRSQPYCRYATHFSAEPVKHLIREGGARYMYLGKELGGRPEGEEYYDAAGHVLYGVVAEAALFRQGIDQLLHGASRYRVAMMCSEEDPALCHRHLLVGRVLDRADIGVWHIRGDGRVQTYGEVELARGAGHGFLFQELEADSWKSIRSVLPKLQRPSSSAGLSGPGSDVSSTCD